MDSDNGLRGRERMMTDNGHEPRQSTEPVPFRFGCSTHIFPPEELDALTARGQQMEALANGTLPATTAEHEHFLQVDREETEPTTVDERAWLRLKGRREFEREQEAAPPPEP